MLLIRIKPKTYKLPRGSIIDNSVPEIPIITMNGQRKGKSRGMTNLEEVNIKVSKAIRE